MKSLAVTFGLRRAADHHLHRLRHLDAHIFGDPGIEDVGGADAEGDAAHGADVRRVRIRADVHLSRQRVGFQHHRVADALAALAVLELAVQLDALVAGEILLLELELRRQVEQAHLALFFRHDLVEKRQVVAEKLDAVAIVHRHALADEVLVEDRRHRRDVLVREAQVHAGETGIAGLDG